MSAPTLKFRNPDAASPQRWIEIGGTESDEVAVQSTDPGSGYDLWFDADAPATVVGVLPPGGSTGQVPTKNSNLDHDVSWQNNPVIYTGPTTPAAPQVGDIWVKPT